MPGAFLYPELATSCAENPEPIGIIYLDRFSIDTICEL
jgi:hypothetical protein